MALTETPSARVERAPSGDNRVVLHMPVDVRSASLAVIAVLGVIFMLRWASAVFIPVMLGLMLSYALSPVVERLRRWGLPRPIGAAALILAIIGGASATLYSMGDDASELIASLPGAVRKLHQAVSGSDSARNPIRQVQQVASEIEKVAESTAKATTPRGVQRVQIERPKFNIQDYLWTGGIGLVGFLGQALVVCFIAYFLVASGDSFRRKMVRLAGPTLSRKKVTIQVLDEITEQIQRYLLVQVLLSVIVGVATWIAFALLGLEHAAVWGVAAAVLNLVPYVGSIAVTLAAALVAFVQFGTLDGALAIGGASLLINSIEGYVLMPWLTSRASRMSPVVVFVGVLAWGWLWGIWGLLLGIPILMALKAVCDRVDDLKPIGELLGA